MTAHRDADETPARKAARRYLAAGLSIIRIRDDGTKSPAHPTWEEFKTHPVTQRELDGWFAPDKATGRTVGIGIVCGQISGNLAVLDFESDAAWTLWRSRTENDADTPHLQSCPVVRTPKGGRHVYARIAEGAVKGGRLALSADGKSLKSEIRGVGNYVLAPGSPAACHPTGNTYEFEAEGWLADPALAPIPLDVFFRWCDYARLDNEFTPKKHSGSPKTGPSGTASGDSPGYDFCHRGSWEETGLFDAGWEWHNRRGDDRGYITRPGKDNGISASVGIVSSVERGWPLFYCWSTSVPEFEAETGYNRFGVYATLKHGGDFSAAAGALRDLGYGADRTDPTPTFGEGESPDTSEFARRFGKQTNGDESPALEFRAFPVNALPEPVQGFVSAAAEAIGCDPSYLVMPLLTAAAAAVGNTRRLEVKRGWLVPPILWTAIIGESGTAKSPPFKLVTQPVEKRQRVAMSNYAEAVKRYEVELAVWDKEYATWKRSKNKFEEPPPKPEAPACERFLVSDTTVEALAPILNSNPRGVLMAQDELAGWFGSFDRYAGKGKGGTDAANWLKMFNGASITNDRKTGFPKTIYVPRAAVCVTGGIQPGILRAALTRGHRDSGLAARLLVSSPPRKAKRWSEAGIDPAAEADLVRLFDNLFALQFSDDGTGEPLPIFVRLTPEAKAVWVAYYETHADEQVKLSGDMAAAWSKLEEYAARLALVIHFIRWAAGDVNDELWLDAASMSAGVTLTTWFKHEARRVYADLEDAEAGQGVNWPLEVLGWIKNKGGRVKIREVHRRFPYRFKSANEAKAFLEELIEDGHGEWQDLTPTKKVGRPTRVFVLTQE